MKGFEYVGEVDNKNNACGIGIATLKNSDKKYEGLFHNGQTFGICKCLHNDRGPLGKFTHG